MKKLTILLLSALLLASCVQELPADVSVSLAESELQSTVSSETPSADESSQETIEHSEEPVIPAVPESPHGNAFVTGQTEELSFDVQRIGTQDDGDDLDVDILRSVEEKDALLTFYNDEQDHYDEAYFENRSLIAFRITHGSGSITDTVEKVVLREDGTVEVHVTVFYPEAGTCDMAYRYYLIEPEEGYLLSADNPVELYINGELSLSLLGAHEHVYTKEHLPSSGLTAQTHGTGEQTYISRDGIRRMQNSERADRLCTILTNLYFAESNLCSCEADILIDCRYGYNIMLDFEKGFVRYGKKQAILTESQAKELGEIIEDILGDISFGKFSFEKETGHWTDETYGLVKDGFVNTEPCELATAEEALACAANEVANPAYLHTDSFYDKETDMWKFVFDTRETGKNDQTVYMTGDGVTVMIMYGYPK